MVALPRRNQAPRSSRIATRSLDQADRPRRARGGEAPAAADRAPARGRGAAPHDVRRLERLCSTLIEGASEAQLSQAAILQAISHDLRQPLNVILIRAQLLANKTAHDQPHRAQIDAISRAVGDLQQMLNDVSDLAKITSGRLLLNRLSCDPRAMIEEALAPTRSLATSRNIRIETEVEGDAPAVGGDRLRLVKILTDLVGSALKATRVNGAVTVGAARDGAGVRFSVTDTGLGIPEEHRSHVFTIPVVPLGGRPLTVQGAGLAFQVAQGIIEAHGGHIWVESEVGHGSTFCFSLPRGDDQPMDDEGLVSAPNIA